MTLMQIMPELRLLDEETIVYMHAERFQFLPMFLKKMWSRILHRRQQDDLCGQVELVSGAYALLDPESNGKLKNFTYFCVK